jgi:hypothetical protein
MREFRDDQGRPWQVALTVAAAMRVKDNVTVEIEGEKKPFDMVDVASISTTMQVLRGQYTTLAEALYFVLVAQVNAKSLTKEQFLDGLRGDALDAGAKALEGELIDFFPERLRRMVGLLAAKMDEASAELMAKAEKAMQEATTADLLEASGMPSTKPQESSDAIPESGPSESSSPLATAA